MIRGNIFYVSQSEPTVVPNEDVTVSNNLSLDSFAADFSFAAWPEAGIASYDEFRRDAKAINEATPWHAKRDKAFFRGDPKVGSSGSPARYDLMKQVKKPGAETWADVARTSVSVRLLTDKTSNCLAEGDCFHSLFAPASSTSMDPTSHHSSQL